jgi:hypothetical protein
MVEKADEKKSEEKPAPPPDDWHKTPKVGSTARLAWIEQLPGGVTRRHNHYCQVADIMKITHGPPQPDLIVLKPIRDLPRGKRP